MKCINLLKRKNKPFCKKQNKQIEFSDCYNCKNKECKEKQYKPMNRSTKPMKNRSSKLSKECDISQKTKEIVFARDKGKCVICGNSYNVMPNSHYIKRSHNGLGIEQNVFTACTNFTENKCHERWERYKCTEEEKQRVLDNFKNNYNGWNEKELYYNKHLY